MARRKQVRGISKDRVYTVRDAARLVGVTEPTLRKWGKQGLRIIADKRPHLVRGADLIAHVDRKRTANRNDMPDHQMFCMRCQTPRAPKDVQQVNDARKQTFVSMTCNDCFGT